MKRNIKKKAFETEYKPQNLNFTVKFEQKTTIDFTVYTFKHMPVFIVPDTPNKPPPS